MNNAERIWQDKSDEDLLEAAADLDQFTEEGRLVIRAELRRRGLEDPVEQAGDEEAPPAEEEPEEPLECLRCRATLRYLDPGDPAGRSLPWGGAPMFDPGSALHVYACPRCGHVEFFMNLPEDAGDAETK